MEAGGQAGTAPQNGVDGHIVAFEYPHCPDAPAPRLWQGWVEPGEPSKSAETNTGRSADLERKLAEETRKAFEAGREHGRQEGRQAEREAQAAAERERVRLAAELIARFAEERDRYFHNVEREVVKLALAVATRILRREAQMDPLLLTGAVRVALGQLAATTQVRLRVPPAELNLWSEAMALLPNLPLKPEVIAGEIMRLGDCIIETELGSVDLGIRAQLAEIERGFFDRPGAAVQPSRNAAHSAASSATRETPA